MIELKKNVKYVTDIYKVSVTEKETLQEDVCVALLADGTTNNIKLPPEIYAEFDGLGCGTKTLKTYYSAVEFEERAVVEVIMPEGTRSIRVKPKRYEKQVKFNNGKAIVTAEEPMNLYLEPDGDIFGGIHIFCDKKKDIESRGKNVINFDSGIYTAEDILNEGAVTNVVI